MNRTVACLFLLLSTQPFATQLHGEATLTLDSDSADKFSIHMAIEMAKNDALQTIDARVRTADKQIVHLSYKDIDWAVKSLNTSTCDDRYCLTVQVHAEVDSDYLDQHVDTLKAASAKMSQANMTSSDAIAAQLVMLSSLKDRLNRSSLSDTGTAMYNAWLSLRAQEEIEFLSRIDNDAKWRAWFDAQPHSEIAHVFSINGQTVYRGYNYQTPSYDHDFKSIRSSEVRLSQRFKPVEFQFPVGFKATYDCYHLSNASELVANISTYGLALFQSYSELVVPLTSGQSLSVGRGYFRTANESKGVFQEGLPRFCLLAEWQLSVDAADAPKLAHSEAFVYRHIVGNEPNSKGLETYQESIDNWLKVEPFSDKNWIIEMYRAHVRQINANKITPTGDLSKAYHHSVKALDATSSVPFWALLTSAQGQGAEIRMVDCTKPICSNSFQYWAPYTDHFFVTAEVDHE